MVRTNLGWIILLSPFFMACAPGFKTQSIDIASVTARSSAVASQTFNSELPATEIKESAAAEADAAGGVASPVAAPVVEVPVAPAAAPEVVVPAPVVEADPGPGYFMGIDFQGVIAGEGHIGIDVSWNSNGSIYNPCHQYGGMNDINYGACVMANVAPVSYYKVVNFLEDGSNNFPSGIFIDAWNPNHCSGQPWCQNTGKYVQHGWSSLVTDVGLEIYPKSKFYGGLRANVNVFDRPTTNGKFSNAIGKVALPNELGSIATLNGFIKFMDGLVDSKRVEMAFFQEGGASAVSTTGHPFWSFAATGTNDDGYYNSGILLPGRYKVYITDKAFQKTVIIHVDINGRGERLDFDLAAHCFGFASCE